jgi:hypothetical protein
VLHIKCVFLFYTISARNIFQSDKYLASYARNGSINTYTYRFSCKVSVIVVRL